jgi:hypothetical protein
MKVTLHSANIVLLLLALVGSSRAQEALDERQLKELLHPFYLAEAGRYEFTLDGTPKTKLDLVRTPVLSWTGLESGLTSGDLFVWTRGGRAEVVGCIGSLPRNDATRLVFHEFHALTLEPLPAVQVSNQQWTPEKPGADLRVIVDAPEPAERRPQRLAQMRSIAREFSARMQAASGNEDRMRLLPQPIFRNEASHGEQRADGAIFAFVWTIGTDPELLLLIESRPTADGYRWHYAPLRFTNRTVALDHKGVEVWKVGRHDSIRMPSEPYITRLTGATTIAELQNRDSENGQN